MPAWWTNSDSGPKARPRVAECSPSAPITRSNRRGAAFSNVSSTPPPSWLSAVTVSPNMYSAKSRLAWYRIAARSVRVTSTSRLPVARCRARMLTRPTWRPERLTKLSAVTSVPASAQPFHEAHPVGDLHGRAADVHRAAAGEQPRRAFYDGGTESVPRQPVRHRGPGDTGPGNQDCRAGRGVHHTLLSDGSAVTAGAGRLCAWWRGEPVPGDEPGKPVRLAELQTVPVGQRPDVAGLPRPSGGEVGQLAEEVLEPGRADHLDHPGRHRPGVPHRVQLAARFGDVPAGAEHRLTVAGPEPDLALGDNGVLVLAGVGMRRHKRADGERVLDDGQRTAGVAAPELEHHADGAQVAVCAAAGLHDGELGSLGAVHDGTLWRGEDHCGSITCVVMPPCGTVPATMGKPTHDTFLPAGAAGRGGPPG